MDVDSWGARLFSASRRYKSYFPSRSGRPHQLKSCDGEDFIIDEAVTLQSQTIKHMIEDDCVDNSILLPNVTGKILSKVIEYCKKHVDSSAS